MGPVIKIQSDDEAALRGARFMDDIELLHPDGPDGPIVVTAVKSGVYVCWQCGEPFAQGHPELGEIRKRVDGGPVPIFVHRRCWNGAPKSKFSAVMRGVAIKKQVERIAGASQGIVAAAKGAARIITG